MRSLLGAREPSLLGAREPLDPVSESPSSNVDTDSNVDTSVVVDIDVDNCYALLFGFLPPPHKKINLKEHLKDKKTSSPLLFPRFC